MHFQKAKSCCYFDPPSCAGLGGAETPPIVPARFLGVWDITRDHTNHVFDVVQSHTTSTGRSRASGNLPEAGFAPDRPLSAWWRRSRLRPGSKKIRKYQHLHSKIEFLSFVSGNLSPEGCPRLETDLWMWCATARHQKHYCCGP